MTKRALDGAYGYRGCALKCTRCPHDKRPNMVFVDVTNRCNLNCPICINNTPSMGFLFEPPLEYFDAIFRYFARYEQKPAIQLFGGEPTVRGDIFDIIRLARSYGLPTRLVTNGLALADEDYCRRVIKSRATILIAYDNDDPRTYRILRGSEKALALKLKAIENIRRIGGAKVVLMSLVAKGFNETALPQLLQFCHERRDFIRGIYFMPLAYNWDPSVLTLDDERITSEDIENMVASLFPMEEVEFIPAGIMGNLRTLVRWTGLKPLPFAGAHPNCESMYLLISDGKRYVPVSHYLRCSLSDMVRRTLRAQERLVSTEQRLARGLVGRILHQVGLNGAILRLRALTLIGAVILRFVRWDRLIRGPAAAKPMNAILMILEAACGRTTRKVLARYTDARAMLQLIVLPFEDSATLETHRLERCPCGFAYVDPEESRVKTISTCAWGVHKKSIMRKIADHYAAKAPAAVG